MTLVRNKAPCWWSDKIETCRSVLNVFYVNLYVHSLVDNLKWFYDNARCYNKIFQVRTFLPYFNSITHKATAPSDPRPRHYPGFTITLSHTTLGMNPLDEWSARHRDLYLTTHNTNKKEISMHPSGLETAIPASERPKIHSLESAATGISSLTNTSMYTKDPEYIKACNGCKNYVYVAWFCS